MSIQKDNSSHSDILSFLISNFVIRFNCHIPDKTITTFPVSFLSRIMSGSIESVADEARIMYNNVFESDMMIMPFMRDSHLSVLALVKPKGVLSNQPKSRVKRTSFMLLVDPENVVEVKHISMITRRVRIFLNHLAHKDGSTTKNDKPFHKTAYDYIRIPGA